MVEEILEGQAPPNEAIGASRGLDVSKPTEQKAIRLVSSAEIIATKNIIDAIEYTIRRLEISPEPKKIQLLEMKYFTQRYSDYGVMENLNIAPRTFYRWKRECIQLVASRLGWRV